MTVLSYIAAKTRHIRLGTAVVVLPWHNPVLVAEQVATLDLLSGGRVDFGVGKRWQYYDVVVEPEPLQRPPPPLWLAAGSHDSVRRAAREGYNLLLDQLAQVDQIIQRIAVFREECQKFGRAYDPNMVATSRALQLIHSESEREQAYETRKRVVTMIGDLARDKLAD